MRPGATILSAVGLVLLLAAAATPTAAQAAPLLRFALEHRAGQFEELVPPITGSAEMPVRVSLECAHYSLHLSPEPLLVVHRIEAADPEWTVSVLSKVVTSGQLSTLACADGGSMTDDLNLTVQFTKDAPAFRATTLALESVLEEPGSPDSYWYGETPPARTEWIVVPGFYAKWNARGDPSISRMEMGETRTLQVQIQNVGNGAILIAPSVANPNDNVRVTLPDPIRVGSRAQGDDSNEATFEVVVEPFATGLETVRLALHAVSFDDHTFDAGNAEVAFLLRVGGESLGDSELAPAPAWLGAAAALFLVARLRAP